MQARVAAWSIWRDGHEDGGWSDAAAVAVAMDRGDSPARLLPSTLPVLPHN